MDYDLAEGNVLLYGLCALHVLTLPFLLSPSVGLKMEGAGTDQGMVGLIMEGAGTDQGMVGLIMEGAGTDQGMVGLMIA